MNYFRKGEVKEDQKYLDDRYGNRLHVGASVAFHRNGEVLFGKITSIRVYNVESSSNYLDKATLKIFIKEKLSDKVFEIRNFLSLIYIENG